MRGKRSAKVYGRAAMASTSTLDTSCGTRCTDMEFSLFLMNGIWANSEMVSLAGTSHGTQQMGKYSTKSGRETTASQRRFAPIRRMLGSQEITKLRR